jgi:hypothetical protein
MMPTIDLMLATIERALATAVLPGAGNAAAKEEASLAILFARWLRDVVDHVSAAERASYRDCRATLDEVTARLDDGAAGASARELARAARLSPLDAEATPPAELRQATRQVKQLLGTLLERLRAAGHASLAADVRARLFDLGLREIARERSFGRASTMDPEWQTIASLAEQRRRSR